MAEKGGMFQAMGNLVRWTIWALAGLAVVAIWLGWSNRADGPEAETAAVQESEAAEVPAESAREPETDAETDAAVALQENAEAAVDEVRNAVEQAVGSASEAAEAVTNTVSDVAEAAEDALEDGPGSDEVPASELEEVAEATEGALDEATVIEGAVSDDDADLNVMPEALSEIRVPGDEALYGLVSVFERDDGSIEVVSSKTEDGAELLTTRLVTCAPLAIGVIAEGDGARNEAPELERIPLGSAASLIAALACGAMN